MSGADVFAGFVGGVVIASLFWAMFVGHMLGELDDELELLDRVDKLQKDQDELLDELELWRWGGDTGQERRRWIG